MANYIKYSTNAQTRALKMGNFWLGPVNDGKGPTSSTGYYTALNPPSGGFTIYTNKVSNGPSIFQASNESQLVSITNQLGGTSFTTSAQCLTWYVTQTDKFCVNREYEGIVTNGLVLNLDAGFTPSYPTSGTSWYDLGPNGNTGVLTNGPTFSSSNGGSIVFDGTNDYVSCGNSSISLFGGLSYEIWIKLNANNRQQGFFGINNFPTFITNFWMNTDNKMRLEIGVGEFSSPSIYSTTQFNTTQWYHVAASIENGGKFILYINGVAENQTPFLKTLTSTSGTIIIGSYDYASYYGNASIPVSRIYNRALSSVEVLQNYNAQKGRFGL